MLGGLQGGVLPAITNPKLSLQGKPGVSSSVPIEALPAPAAMLAGVDQIVEENAGWARAFPESPTGTSAVAWFDRNHKQEHLRVAFASGLRSLAAGVQKTIEIDCPDYKVSASAYPGGTLVVVLGLRPEGDAKATADETERAAQAQKMETLGRLASGVAHDFANLLTLISGYTDILLNRVGEKGPLLPELDEIRKAANRGARLTSQLLGFTRGQAVQPRVLDLNGLIMDVQRMLRPIIGENVELELALSPELVKVVADPGQMEQVIMNLILNARDAMPGGGRILIESANSTLDGDSAREHGMPAGGCVLVSISDTGHGIEAEAIEHIFEPFVTTKAKGKGTGLGLSTVLGIVKDSGGDIWVQSAPGHGATFTICLPGGDQAAVQADPPVVPRPVHAGSETVLLVEDEDGVRKLLKYVLEKRGYRVFDAACGEDALDIFKKRGDEVHLLLTDMVMPKMTGRELTAKLQEMRPDLKAVYMSGYTDDVLVSTGALGPGMSFLQKPLRPDVLAAKVREALDSPVRPFNPR